ncbi:phage tail assembly protein [Chitinibacter fontanus]|uniref:Phage tail assembly protein n=1 Tax=Chitinibacter fontanus TaxID=1737446 RepID=A0A7D5ZF96_9NEIS|nr:phage tail assembly protein [Chitinibacter fontanus]QLI80789.1 phage tail assembly protein [Chitinibacter fontanus]
MSQKVVWQSFPLRKSVQAFESLVSKLELAEPTGELVEEIGDYPFYPAQGPSGDPVMKLSPKVLHQWIVRLGDVPESAVRAMHPSDVWQIGMALAGFFAAGSGSELQAS